MSRVQQSLDVGQQTGRYQRTKELVTWLQRRRRRTIHREEILAFLCGKAVPERVPERRARRSRHSMSLDLSQIRPLHNLSHNPVERNPLVDYTHSVATQENDGEEEDFVQFQDALDQGKGKKKRKYCGFIL